MSAQIVIELPERRVEPQPIDDELREALAIIAAAERIAPDVIVRARIEVCGEEPR